MFLVLAAFLVATAAGSVIEDEEAFDLVADFNGVDQFRTFTTLNSTYLVYAIAAGALLVLFLAVGLYIYDFYYGTTSRVDVEQNYNYQYYQDQAYQNAEQAYPYQQYRYVVGLSIHRHAHNYRKPFP